MDRVFSPYIAEDTFLNNAKNGKSSHTFYSICGNVAGAHLDIEGLYHLVMGFYPPN